MIPETWPLKSYLPASANGYCFKLWEKYPFEVRLSAPRKTKLGDYRFRPDTGKHLITLNSNLNQYSFLVVYLHEVAHCVAGIKFGHKIKPHGRHWQQEIKAVLAPMMSREVFPGDVLEALMSYLKAPKAASCSHPQLTRVLRKYDAPCSGVPLEQLQDGSVFLFNSKQYQKLRLRRTRVACLEVKNNRKWLISKLALVYPV
jgi:hypothetical protein